MMDAAGLLVIWTRTPCTSETARRFGGTHCLHTENRKVTACKKQAEASDKLNMEAIFSSYTSSSIRTIWH
jgi:hypothetical protein